MRESYDFSQHQVKPSYRNILRQLKTEYDLATAILQNKEQLQHQYNLDNIDTTYPGIELLRGKLGDKEIEFLLRHPDANTVVKKLGKAQ